MENKKRQLYQLFSTLEITQKEFEDWYNKWRKKFEEKKFEEQYEKSLPKLSEGDIRKIDRRIKKYLEGNHEHEIKSVYNFIQRVYMGYGFNKEEAKDVTFTELVFRIVTPTELLYLMENVSEKRKNKT